MIKETLIRQHLESILDGTEMFPVSIRVLPGNRIMVFLDGDHGVSIDDCVQVSRQMEALMDRDQEDFELQVSSAGADQPLTLPRQYPRHCGRKLAVTLNDGSLVKGQLLEVKPEGILLLIPANKKTKEAEHKKEMTFTEIKNSKVEISFK